MKALKVYRVRKIFTDGVYEFEYFLQWKYSNVFPYNLKFWWSSLGKYPTFEEAFSKIPNGEK